MSFMEAQMTKKIEWVEVDGDNGFDWIPFDILTKTEAAAVRALWASPRFGMGRTIVGIHPRYAAFQAAWEAVSKYTESRKVYAINIVKGYGVRSSAPGYMDATPWSVYTSLKNAKRAFAEEKRACRGEEE